MRVEHLRLADILEREPDLTPIGCCRDIGAEGACLLDPADDLMVGNSNDIDLGAKDEQT